MIEAESDLLGPDVADEPVEPIEEVGNPIDIRCRQFVNRWVFLAHHRPVALSELKDLLVEARKAD